MPPGDACDECGHEFPQEAAAAKPGEPTRADFGQRYRWLLIGLLLAASLAVVLAFVGALQDALVIYTYEYSVVGLAFGQVGLMSAWMALGHFPGPLRLLAAVGGIILWALLFKALALRIGPNSLEWLVLFLIEFASVTALLYVVRWVGLGRVDVLQPAPSTDGGRARFQFTIAQMMGWTTGLAVALGLLRWVGLFDAFPRDALRSAAGLTFIGPGRAIVALAAVWAVLGTRWLLARVAVLVLAEALSLGIPCMIQLPGRHELPYLILLMTVEAIVLVGSLLVVRLAGYRVQRRVAAFLPPRKLI